jgi:hypothetical protein
MTYALGTGTGVLSADSIAAARAWINQQWGGSFGANGQFAAGSAFNADGTLNTSDTLRNVHVIGAAEAMGLSAGELQQVTGIDAGTITSYASVNQPLISSAASVFDAVDRPSLVSMLPAAAPPAQHVTADGHVHGSNPPPGHGTGQGNVTTGPNPVVQLKLPTMNAGTGTAAAGPHLSPMVLVAGALALVFLLRR